MLPNACSRQRLSAAALARASSSSGTKLAGDGMKHRRRPSPGRRGSRLPLPRTGSTRYATAGTATSGIDEQRTAARAHESLVSASSRMRRLRPRHRTRRIGIAGPPEEADSPEPIGRDASASVPPFEREPERTVVMRRHRTTARATLVALLLAGLAAAALTTPRERTRARRRPAARLPARREDRPLGQLRRPARERPTCRNRHGEPLARTGRRRRGRTRRVRGVRASAAACSTSTAAAGRRTSTST